MQAEVETVLGFAFNAAFAFAAITFVALGVGIACAALLLTARNHRDWENDDDRRH